MHVFIRYGVVFQSDYYYSKQRLGLKHSTGHSTEKFERFPAPPLFDGTNYQEFGHFPKGFRFQRRRQAFRRKRASSRPGCPAKQRGKIRYCWNTTCLPYTRNQVCIFKNVI